MTLRQRMDGLLGENWRDRLLEGRNAGGGELWRAFFQGCAPDLARLPNGPEAQPPPPIFPGSHRAPAPGARAGSHLCKAFDRLVPEQVRVVVLGQDPYPSIAQATGRAFEDGAWGDERPQDLASSLKPLMLAALATQDGNANLFRSGGWPALIRDNRLALPELGGYFDALAEQGVLFVNEAWTRTREEHEAAHQALWRPVTDHLIGRLAAANQPVVFLLLGGRAKEAFCRICRTDQTFRQSAIVPSAHPSPQGQEYYRGGNPLARVNSSLRVLRAAEIDWWPVQQVGAGDAG